MRGILRAIGTAAMAVLASMSLVACGGSGSDEVVVVTVTSTPGVPLDVPQDQQQDQQGQSDSGVDLGKLRSAYEQVLAAPPDLDTLTHEDFEAFGAPTVTRSASSPAITARTCSLGEIPGDGRRSP